MDYDEDMQRILKDTPVPSVIEGGHREHLKLRLVSQMQKESSLTVNREKRESLRHRLPTWFLKKTVPVSGLKRTSMPRAYKKTGYAIAVATGIFALIAISLWSPNSKNGIVWADVMRQINNVETLTYWVTVTEEDSGSEGQGTSDKMIKRFFFKDPGRSRIESYKIPSASPWLQPDSEQLVNVWIDRRTVTPTMHEHTFIELLPRRKRAFLSTNVWPETVPQNLAYRAMRMWNEMEEIAWDEAKQIGERVIDGIQTVGFEIPGEVLPTRTGRLDECRTHVWVTRDTAIPVLVESEHRGYRSGGLRDPSGKGYSVKVKSLVEGIEWNVPLPDELFEFPSVDGWKFSENRMERFDFSRTRMQADLMLEVRPQHGPVLLTESDFVKEISGASVSERTEDGQKSRNVSITLLLTKAGAEKLKAFVADHPGERLMVDFNGEVQNEIEIQPSPMGNRNSRVITFDEKDTH